MKLLNFTIIKLTASLILGIAIGYLFSITLTLSFVLCGIGFALFLITYLIAKKQFINTPWFGIIAILFMVCIGLLTTNLHNQKNFKNHYTKSLSNNNESLNNIRFRIRDVLKSGANHDKYIIDLLDVNGIKVSGKLLLNIEKTTQTNPLHVDAIYIGIMAFKAINSPLNPNQFNYKLYLDKKYIYHQIFTNQAALFKIQHNSKTIFGIANSIRNYINKKIKRYHFNADELAIINALLLGQRQDISDEMYSSYTNAGAIHILAVSGLHVGIILLILQFILKPLIHLKHGRLLRAILLVSMLWSFAVIAGLSASVTRAVAMFSIVAVAQNLKRPTNIYNTLAISILILLLFNPLFLFDVGFQLSYLAVFAIVAIDPFLYKLWKPKYWLIDKYWHTLTVTISAQFGIIPVSLFYFHQFPGLFFFSNLVIIPFLEIILGFGIGIILLATCNILPQYIADIYGYIIRFMNLFIDWISKQEAFLFEDIPFHIWHVIASYLLIIASVRLLIKRNYFNLKLFLIVILIGQSTVIYSAFKKPTNAFIVFHKSRFSLLGNTKNNTITVTTDFDSLTAIKDKIIRNYTIENMIKTIKKDAFQSVYLLNDKTMLVVDSLGVYNIKTFKPDYVLLRQSPKINLNRLIDSIKPKHIIADGSNYKSYTEHWEAICVKQKIPFYQTSKKGAFVIRY